MTAAAAVVAADSAKGHLKVGEDNYVRYGNGSINTAAANNARELAKNESRHSVARSRCLFHIFN